MSGLPFHEKLTLSARLCFKHLIAIFLHLYFYINCYHMLFSYNILDMVKEIEIEYCGS